MSRSTMSGDTNWKTNMPTFPQIPSLGPRDSDIETGGAPGYWREGFLAVQLAVDMAIIKAVRPNTTIADRHLINKLNKLPSEAPPLSPLAGIILKRFPYAPYNFDGFVIIVAGFFPFLIMISLIYTVIVTAKYIGAEKESGMKEAMRLMGMKMWIYWLSWYIQTMVFLIPSIVLSVIGYNVQVPLSDGSGATAAILQHVDPTLFAVFMLLYASSSITFVFMCTTLFKKANSAAIFTGIIWFVTYLPYLFVSLQYEDFGLAAKIALCFINNMAMSLGFLVIGRFMGNNKPVNFDTWTKGVTDYDTFSLIQILIPLFLNNFLYLTLMYYIDQINPGDMGIKRVWYFPIQSIVNRFKKNAEK